MLIRLGYDIEFETTADVPLVALLNVHTSREKDLRELDEVHTDPGANLERFLDRFRNRDCRFVAKPGLTRLFGSTLVEDSGQPDPQARRARDRSRTAAGRRVAVSDERQELRGRSAFECRGRGVWRDAQRVGAGAGDLRLGAEQG